MKQNIIYNGIAYELNYHNDLINKIVSTSNNFFEHWLLEPLKKKINSFDFVIDIGANVGNHSFFFKNICGAKRLIAFEPLKQNIELLKQNCTNIEIYEFAISSLNSSGKLMLRDELNNNSGTAVVSDFGYDIELRTLDSFEFKSPTFIKIDVEGHELYVLEGALNTINSYHPQLLIEVHIGVNVSDILQYLPGYIFEKIGHEEHYLFTYKG